MEKKYIITVLVAIVGVVLMVVIGMSGFGLKITKAPTTPSVTISTSTITAASSTAIAGSSSTILVTTPTSTVKKYEGKSFSFNYPSSWNILNYWPLVIANFTTYNHGGIIPPEGAEIDMVTTTTEGGFSEIAKTELMGVSHITTSTIIINDMSCLRADYIADNNNSIGFKDVALYCARGSEVWKIYFSYRSDDTTAAAHRADFEMVLKSLRFP